MDWLQYLAQIPVSIAATLVMGWFMTRNNQQMVDNVKSGFQVAVDTLKEQVDELRDEVKTSKQENREERQALSAKITTLENQHTSEISQKLDLILQKV